MEALIIFLSTLAYDFLNIFQLGATLLLQVRPLKLNY